MPKVERTHRVCHSAQNMYALVSDVEKYPEFFFFFEALEIQSRREKKGREILVASMRVGYKGFNESFQTQVTLNPDDSQINAQYLDGPFKYLDNRWRFDVVDESTCDIQFFIDYEFKNRILGSLMGSMFDRAFNKYVEAFEARADALYNA
ncbi:MAG: type II toxin-antitoxin system RatA family toxin [Nitratireductor sp.]